MVELGAPKRFLVVERDRHFREALKEVLQNEGHAVETAADGAQAIELALVRRPDVVMLDYGASWSSSGSSLVDSLRRALHPPPVFLAISGRGRAEGWCTQQGIPLFLRKPFGLTTLRNKVADAVELAVREVMEAEREAASIVAAQTATVLVVSDRVEEGEIEDLLPAAYREAHVVMVEDEVEATRILGVLVPDLIIVEGARGSDDVVNMAMARSIAVLVRTNSSGKRNLRPPVNPEKEPGAKKAGRRHRLWFGEPRSGASSPPRPSREGACCHT